MSANLDLAIVGSGGAAFAAANAARDRGLRVVMIERGVVGGTCVNVGCIPSKALLAAADHRKEAGEQRFAGTATSAGPVDFVGLVAAKDELVGQMRQDKYIDLADEYGFELIHGEATFVSGPALQVGDRRIEAKHYLIATGAEPVIPPIPGLAESGYLTSTTAMELAALPTACSRRARGSVGAANHAPPGGRGGGGAGAGARSRTGAAAETTSSIVSCAVCGGTVVAVGAGGGGDGAIGGAGSATGLASGCRCCLRAGRGPSTRRRSRRS